MVRIGLDLKNITVKLFTDTLPGKPIASHVRPIAIRPFCSGVEAKNFGSEDRVSMMFLKLCGVATIRAPCKY